MADTLRVLLVDDSRRYVRLLVDRLQALGYRPNVRSVADEADLRRRAREGAWDVVFCAWPAGPLDVAHLVLVLGEIGLDLPVIALSVAEDEHAVMAALEQGADDCLAAPALTRLASATRRALGTASARRASAGARRALAESEEHFRRLFDLASVGLAEIDPRALRIVRANAALGRIAGCTVAELQARSMTDFFPLEDGPPVLAQLDRLAHSAPVPPVTFERQVVRSDGTRVWAGINLNVQLDAEGRPLRLVAAFEDISSRKVVEAEQRRLSTAVEQAAEAIVITDTSPRIVYVNPAFERISGYTKAEAVGQNPRMLKSGRHDPQFYERMWVELRSGASWSGLMVNKRKDGTLYYEEATISPVLDEAGQAVNYVAVKRDVTYEREVEEQFRQSQKLEAIGQLAGGIAHDFNNILSVIKGHADLLEAAQSPAVRESADEISRAANRAAGLTRQLLLFSRRQPLQLTPGDLNDIVSNMSRMLERILGEDITAEFRYATEPLPIVVDTGMMDQVLLNLAVNSRDAMPRGGRLEVHTATRVFVDGSADLPGGARPGTYVCLTVADSGAGIPADVLPHVFEPFFTTKEVGKGTGLGLATVLGIVQQHDGWVDVRSEVGKGTTVCVCIPKTAAPAWRADRVRESSMPGGEETILLVEDDVALRRLVRSILASLGYRVLESSSGRDAVGVWTQHQQEIKLLLTDLVMPDGMSGLELARLLLGHNPKLRVIYSSGYSPDVAGNGVALREGVNFLTKPYSPQVLAETVRARLDDPE